MNDEQLPATSQPEGLQPELQAVKQEMKTELKQQLTASLPLVIILAALIVAASIVYSANLIAKKLTAPETVQQAQNTVPAPGSRTLADRSNEPILGNPDAKITMVEFADFQCPFCQAFYHNTFPQIKTKYIDTGKVKFVYREFPLSIHQNAQIAAVAAECANNQGKFFDYYNLLFQNGQPDGKNLDAASLKKYAGQLKMNTNQFNQCVDTSQTLPQVTEDVNAGTAVGINGTPTFFINGQRIVGAQDLSVFEQALNQ